VRRLSTRLALALAAAAAGCTGVQSVLEPSGPHAARVAVLWWWMLAAGTGVFIAVSAMAILAVYRRRREDGDREEADRRHTPVVAGAVAATVLILFGVLVGSLATGTANAVLRDAEDPLVVEVTGRMWWWHVRYDDPVAARQVVSANELHVPVGRAVEVRLRSDDVIHSFWVPRLAGKTDMVPGRTNLLRLRADAPGVYRGQCAEFCGLQHAHMAFVVVAHPPQAWEAWMEAHRRPAGPPATPSAARGEEVFMQTNCAQCHAVRGRGAVGEDGPDLTHFGRRRTLAAATLPNTRGNLAAWIVDPQHVKPGSHMPPTDLDPESLHALLDYLQGLR
jgi:cytochrome c oxidase subunit II